MSKIQRILSYYAVFDPAEEGGYNVSFPNLPGCVTFGKTFEEAENMAEEALGLWLEELAERKQVIPRYSNRPIVHQIDVELPAGTK